MLQHSLRFRSAWSGEQWWSVILIEFKQYWIKLWFFLIIWSWDKNSQTINKVLSYILCRNQFSGLPFKKVTRPNIGECLLKVESEFRQSYCLASSTCMSLTQVFSEVITRPMKWHCRICKKKYIGNILSFRHLKNEDGKADKILF